MQLDIGEWVMEFNKKQEFIPDSIALLSPEVLPTNVLARALEETRERLARAKNQMSALEQMLSLAQEEEQILVRLMALREGKISVAPTREVASAVAAESDRSVVEAVVAILQENGRPGHMSELMPLLRKHNDPLTGARTQAHAHSYLRL